MNRETVRKTPPRYGRHGDAVAVLVTGRRPGRSTPKPRLGIRPTPPIRLCPRQDATYRPARRRVATTPPNAPERRDTCQRQSLARDAPPNQVRRVVPWQADSVRALDYHRPTKAGRRVQSTGSAPPIAARQRFRSARQREPKPVGLAVCHPSLNAASMPNAGFGSTIQKNATRRQWLPTPAVVVSALAIETTPISSFVRTKVPECGLRYPQIVQPRSTF